MNRPYPWYYAVNDRPVKIVQLPSGHVDCLVLDFATCKFVPNRDYFSQVLPGPGKDVDLLTKAEFEQLVAWHRHNLLRRLLNTPIRWHLSHNPNGDGPTYHTIVNGTEYELRINPPEKVAYTLLACGEEVGHFSEWPDVWLHPGTPAPTPQDSSPSIDPGLLRRWSEQLCHTPSDYLSDIAALLGFEAAAATHENELIWEAPQVGATRVRLVRHPLGWVYLQVDVLGSTLTRARLDAHFGEGMKLPLLHPTSAYNVAYQVEVPGAPFKCTVIASFDDMPTDRAAAKEVTLRRDPAQT